MKRCLICRPRRRRSLKNGPICRIRKKAGLTLVELVVSMLLMSMMMAMIVGILSPAAKIFVRMQKLQYAQQVLDNTAAQLRSMAGEANQYVKIYADAVGIADAEGAAQGPVLEFVNTEGYVTLLSADGSGRTELVLGDTKVDEAEEVPKGRLLARYYNAAGTGNTYSYIKGGTPVARAAAQIFTDGFYMGNYLQMEFSYPAGTADGDSVTYLTAMLSLYSDAGCSSDHLVATEDVILDFRYFVERRDDVTAVTDAAP